MIDADGELENAIFQLELVLFVWLLRPVCQRFSRNSPSDQSWRFAF